MTELFTPPKHRLPGGWVTDGRHVWPWDDLRPHVDAPPCWCNPSTHQYEDGRQVLVHNSMDQREKYERGERLKS